MKTFASISFAAFLIAAGSGSAMAQQQAPPAQDPPAQEQPKQEAQVQSVDGDLIKVDAESKKLTVKGADGAEMQFSYTDETVISGQEGTQGLATIEGSKVRVYFTTTNEARTATRVEVQPASDSEKK